MQDEYSMETPWEISAAGFPQHGPADDQLRFLLRYAILAPSTRNTQPWKFRVQGEAVEIFADPGRWLKIADQNQRELYISIGCALENLLIAARHFGFAPQVDYLPDPGNSGLAARVTLGGAAAIPLPAEDLFPALLDRQTHHRGFTGVPVPPPLLQRLQACCTAPGVTLLLSCDAQLRQGIDRLALRADILQFADPDYIDELKKEMTRGAFDPAVALEKLHRLALAALVPDDPATWEDHTRAQAAPLLGLLATDQDSLKMRIQVGQVFERLWLTATGLGLRLQPMTQALQLAPLREALAHLTGTGDRFPQQFFQLGYAVQAAEAYTPRRPLEAALIE
jgi:nitroreductase